MCGEGLPSDGSPFAHAKGRLAGGQLSAIRVPRGGFSKFFAVVLCHITQTERSIKGASSAFIVSMWLAVRLRE